MGHVVIGVRLCLLTNYWPINNLIAAVQFSLIPKFRNSEIQKIKSNRLIDDVFDFDQLFYFELLSVFDLIFGISEFRTANECVCFDYACTNHHISHNLIAAVQFSLIPKFRNSEIPKIKSNRLSNCLIPLWSRANIPNRNFDLWINNPSSFIICQWF